MHDSTPLERFTDYLASQTELTNLTESGTNELRRLVRAAVPHLTAATLNGWNDWTGGAVEQAINAAEAAMPENETREQDALYVVGVLVGLCLAHALRGADLTERDS